MGGLRRVLPASILALAFTAITVGVMAASPDPAYADCNQATAWVYVTNGPDFGDEQMSCVGPNTGCVTLIGSEPGNIYSDDWVEVGGGFSVVAPWSPSPTCLTG